MPRPFRRVLIADDHPGFREAVIDFLPEPPAEVIECCDGREAVEAYARHQPDLVLMDLDMPEVDGLSATRQIRARWPEARIIVLTMHDRDEFRRSVYAAGAVAFFSKSNLAELSAHLSH